MMVVRSDLREGMEIVREGEEGRFMKKKRRMEMIMSESESESEEKEGMELNAIPIPTLMPFLYCLTLADTTLEDDCAPHPLSAFFPHNKSTHLQLTCR